MPLSPLLIRDWILWQHTGQLCHLHDTLHYESFLFFSFHPSQRACTLAWNESIKRHSGNNDEKTWHIWGASAVFIELVKVKHCNFCSNYLWRKGSAGRLKTIDWPRQCPDFNPIKYFWTCQRWKEQIFQLEEDKIGPTSSDICCAQSIYRHLSWTFWQEIIFWRPQ